MGASGSVTAALEGAKKTLGEASKFTQSVEGNPTSSFAPKKPETPRLPQAKRMQDVSYSLAKQAGSTAAGLQARRENVEQYLKGTK